MDISDSMLENGRAWEKHRIRHGNEPPWAWYQYMKLVETLDAILASRKATKVHLPESAQRRDTALRLVGSTVQKDTPPRHPTDPHVQTPM